MEQLFYASSVWSKIVVFLIERFLFAYESYFFVIKDLFEIKIEKEFEYKGFWMNQLAIKISVFFDSTGCHSIGYQNKSKIYITLIFKK